jgi:hypothetical protein
MLMPERDRRAGPRTALRTSCVAVVARTLTWSGSGAMVTVIVSLMMNLRRGGARLHHGVAHASVRTDHR